MKQYLRMQVKTMVDLWTPGNLFLVHLVLYSYFQALRHTSNMKASTHVPEGPVLALEMQR